MNAKDAKERVLTWDTKPTKSLSDMANYYVGQGYLSALEGPEVRTLIQACELAMRNVPSQFITDFAVREIMEKAISKYRSATSTPCQRT